jgi:hypothetical protein
MRSHLSRVRRYVADPEPEVVRRIASHLGIALHRPDASLVAASDPLELRRIREGFCMRHLGLTRPQAEAAIADVCLLMRGDRRKCRVTFYYLLADRTGCLERFRPGASPSEPRR